MKHTFVYVSRAERRQVQRVRTRPRVLRGSVVYENYLRSLINQETLAILSIESEVTNSIDVDDVIKNLASEKARKII